MTPPIEELARGLTEAQRRRLVNPLEYCDPNTSRSLRRRGFMDGIRLTPLGLTLRAYLEKTHGG